MKEKRQKNISKSEKRFRNLMDFSPMSIQGYDTKGIVKYWNKASEKIYGYSAKEAIGKNLGDLIVPKNLKSKFRQALEIGKNIKKSGEFMPAGELMLLHKKGHLVPVFSIHTAVYSKGKEPELFCIDVDLSQKKKTEQALKESEKKYRSIVDHASLVIARINLKGKYVLVNKKFLEMTGFKEKEIIGKGPEILKPFIADKEFSKMFEAGTKTLTQKVETRTELCFKDKEGKEHWILQIMYPWYDSKGKLGGAEIISEEITERKNMELEKEKLQKKIQEYAEKLELKVKKLENKIGLTDKEKKVLWGVTRYPDLTDKKLSKKIKLKRSTITSIRNRLRKKELFRVVNIPNFEALGYEMITLGYVKFNKEFEKRKRFDNLYNTLNNPKIVNLCSTDNEGFFLMFSKSLGEFQKIIGGLLYPNNQQIYKTEPVFINLPLDINKIHKFFDFSDVLKSMLNIKINDGDKKNGFSFDKRKLKKNEKKVLKALIEYPELSIYDLTFKTDLTRATIARIKQKLKQDGFFKTKIVPNMKKLGFELIVLTHANFNSDPKMDFNMQKMPHIISCIGGKKESIAISYFLNYSDYKNLKEKIPNHSNSVFAAEPEMYEMPIKNLKLNKLDFVSLANEILG